MLGGRAREERGLFEGGERGIFFPFRRTMSDGRKNEKAHLDERTALSSGPDGDGDDDEDDAPLLPRPTISGDAGALTAVLPEEEATALMALAPPRERASGEGEDEGAADEPAAAATTMEGARPAPR